MRNVTISSAISPNDYLGLVAASHEAKITLSSLIAIAVHQLIQKSPEEIERLRKMTIKGKAASDGKR